MRSRTRACSGCGQEKNTVDRNRFDGLCAECTDRALYDEAFAEAAKLENEKLKQSEIPM